MEPVSVPLTLHPLCPNPATFRYEAEAIYFDPKVRGEKASELQAKLQALAQPLVQAQTQALAGAKLK